MICVVNMSVFLSKNGVIGSALFIVVSITVCVRMDADSYRGLGSDSVRTHT